MNLKLKDQTEPSGLAVLRGFLSAGQVNDLRMECERLLASDYVHPDNIRSRFQRNSGELPERFDPVTDISAPFRNVAEDARLVGAMNGLFGVSPVLFKDKLILKPPGSEGYPMHQDYAWWGHLCDDPAAMCTAMVAIDDMTAENGAVEFFPERELVAVSRDMNAAEAEKVLAEGEGQLLTMKAGDVVLFSALTPHRSGANRTGNCRRVLYFTYNDKRFGNLREPYYQYYIARERADSAQKRFW